ncbi:hypothetical protein BX286_5275 [Streptomyces sp. 3211.6]|uniref:hypothetical protein n=1 Tax=Streptomyces TaxID=1883 RepID=UPI0009A52E36|nr:MULTISPECIES: hypothetical protein [Streptomyces]RKT07220.1 hypothetical protein BX286_5275 [Streptomyces sp. 3211.6]RPF45173.1 hypothetical protein EDD96_1725 [Streptomyces sp. Ag109_G2-6]
MARPEVEIFWPSSLPADPALEGQDALREAGVPTTCMLRPTRRGAGEVVTVLVTTAVMQPFLSTLFQLLAKEAHTGLKTFVDRLLGGHSEGEHAPEGVVFESATGGRVTFSAGLPERAYEQAVHLDAYGDRWIWDSRRSMWTPA